MNLISASLVAEVVDVIQLPAFSGSSDGPGRSHGKNWCSDQHQETPVSQPWPDGGISPINSAKPGNDRLILCELRCELWATTTWWLICLVFHTMKTGEWWRTGYFRCDPLACSAVILWGLASGGRRHQVTELARAGMVGWVCAETVS